MFDAQTTALLRALLNEVCEDVSRYENGVRAHVATKILESARPGEKSADDLRKAGRIALQAVPTMCR
jgi:hypothetical protein